VRSRRAALAGLAVLSLTATGLTACNLPSTPWYRPCVAAPALDRLPDDGVLLGVNPEWERLTLEEYGQAVGHDPAVAVAFTDVPFTPSDRRNILSAAEQAGQENALLLLTLEPHQGLDAMTPEVHDQIAGLAAEINADSVAVVIRFAHEMNGSWYAWGQQPSEYVATFRALADAVDEVAAGTEMMWAPNYGGGYPFAGGEFEAPVGSRARDTLDTNDDGELERRDDPYAPYYPGDDVVDWVGMSLYHWGSDHPWGENEVPEPDKLADQLTGEYVGLGGDDAVIPDFYGVYGEDHGKPVALTETAALVTTGTEVSLELEIKQAWWSQVLDADLPEQFPQLRMINWFDWEKEEIEVGGRVDWTVTRTPAITEVFRSDVPDWALGPGDLEGRCG
jgi:hypothetical protein